MSVPLTDRNTILQAFATIMVKALNAGPDSEHIGAPEDGKIVINGWRLFVWFTRDYGSHMEGESAQDLRVTTTLLRKNAPDEALGRTDLLAMSTMFQTMYDAVRRAADSPADTAFEGLGLSVFEDEESGGITCEGFDVEGATARIGALWRVNYRKRITTS